MSTTETNQNPPAGPKLIVVTDEVPKSAVGAIVYWKLAAKTDVEALETAWKAADLEKVLGKPPAAPTPEVALSRAVAEQKAKRRLVRPLAKAKEGYAIVAETVEEGKDPDYKVLVRVKLNAALKPAFEPQTSDLAVEIRNAYREHLNSILTEDLSTWLVERMVQLEASSLKPTGGVYFVPAYKMDLLDKVRAVLASVGGTSIFKVPAMRSEDATLAFVEAITDEARASVAAVLEEIQKGELGERALETRAKTARALSEKIERYEQLLGTRLDALKQEVQSLAGAVSAASLAVSAA